MSIALILLLAAVEAPAPPERCAETLVDSEIAACLYRDLEALDRQLASELARARVSLAGFGAAGAEARAALDRSQVQWLAHRASDCQAMPEALAGGTMRQLEMPNCLLRMTEERLERVRADFPGGS